MINSAVQICNMALKHINVQTITSLEENTKQAQECAFYYDIVRQSLLVNLNASFSIARAQLVEKKDYTPIYGYDKAFALPHNCLQVLNLGDPQFDEYYQIEGDNFYCTNDVHDVKIRYIKDVKDVNMFDPQFKELLALAIAVEICIPLTEDYNKLAQLEQKKLKKYQECSVKYGRDNRMVVINKPRYRNTKYYPEILNSNYPVQ